MPIQVYLHRRQNTDSTLLYDMRSPQKTRLKSKRNLKNLNQNVQNPNKDSNKSKGEMN